MVAPHQEETDASSPGRPGPSHLRKMRPEDTETRDREPAAGGGVGEEEDEREKTVEEVSEEESDTQEESRALNTVTAGATDRTHQRGLTRRGPGQGNGALPAKVIVTASVRRGPLLDDTLALDRNLPPPRLLETTHPEQQGTYRVNYPGARLRVGAPRPSHLTPTHETGVVITRKEGPHSINFGSSSLSMGAYHHPREPVKFYNAAHPTRRPLAGPPQGPPTYSQRPHPQPLGLQPLLQGTQVTQIHQQDLEQHLQGLPQRSQGPPQRPQGPPQHPVGPQPQKPQFRPSKLLPPTTRHTTTTLTTTTTKTDPPPTTLRTRSELKKVTPSIRDAAPPRSDNSTPPLKPSEPLPSRRGQVVNAPSPALTALLSGVDQTSSLTPLGTISKSGVRAEIGHRAGTAGGHDPSSNLGHQHRPPVTPPNRHPLAGYTRPDGSPYNFVSGEVYTPPPLVQRNKFRNTQKPYIRITTRRPGEHELPAGPFQENHSTYIPKYVKENIAEMEYEPKTFEAPPPPAYHNPNWFLMPVQGWFVLSIILAALLIVLIVVCAIIYNSLRNQRKKLRKLLSPGLVLPGCVDPVNHEVCQCRSLAPLVRSHTLMSRASAMSRASHRSVHPSSRHQGAIKYDDASQPKTTGFRSLPTPALPDGDRDNNNLDSITTTHTQLEVEDSPPPLVPKKTSLTGSTTGVGTGAQDSRGGGRESRQGNPENRSGRESRLGGHEARSSVNEGRGSGYDGRYSYGYGGRSGGHEDSYGKGNGSQYQRPAGSHNSDVQLTTIYPPPRRFEL
ncbi:uncharacterized protein LOC121864591 isoform X2 [Homarus americanus]|uniref:uncharacterized protein LOC121864591 isoform X2 n=1 Tax=Homarus americanus TaxID=6706 RepID=UPI001C46DBB3|nr:uncharacterized protein LOC121864591 isoform X2 [Homarus americanus]